MNVYGAPRYTAHPSTRAPGVRRAEQVGILLTFYPPPVRAPQHPCQKLCQSRAPHRWAAVHKFVDKELEPLDCGSPRVCDIAIMRARLPLGAPPLHGWRMKRELTVRSDVRVPRRGILSEESRFSHGCTDPTTESGRRLPRPLCWPTAVDNRLS